MFDTVKWFYSVVGVFFVVYLLGYSTFLLISVIIGALKLYREHKMRHYHNEILHGYDIPVTIIVPAYNEEITVADTVKSLLMMDYRLYEIVVVDDGSKDGTTQTLLDSFPFKEINRPIQRRIQCKKEIHVYEANINGISVTLVQKENGGKADALNMGINASRYPYFICMDADSVLQRDSLKYIVRPVMEDDSVVAVGGLVRISNYAVLDHGRLVNYHMPWNPVVGMQILEYDRSFMASRILMDRYNGNLIISGAFGLFEKETVMNVGGYDASTMGEDMELVVKLHAFCRINKLPYSIRYAPDAICWSQCPSSIKDLKKQRRRWYLGLYQCLKKHKKMFLAPEFGMVGYISYLYYLVYELLSPFIELFGMFTIVMAYLVDLINVPFMILFFLIYAVYGAVLTLTAFFARIYTQNIKLLPMDVVKAVYLCIAESVFFRFIQAFTRMTAFIGYKKKKNVWGQIKRQKIQLNRTEEGTDSGEKDKADKK
ncbi:glycosyltransferase family 2 protein [Blautia schinkii]|nr:glycosyltransferase family 2 protein [Blautia schinkii]